MFSVFNVTNLNSSPTNPNGNGGLPILVATFEENSVNKQRVTISMIELGVLLLSIALFIINTCF
jgi:hypothetical protein